MSPAPSVLGRAWQQTVRALHGITIVLFAVLVLDVLWGVISRYTPGIVPSDWTEELAVYLLVWVSLLGSAVTYRERGHLGVDYLVNKFDPAAQRLTGIVIEVCVIIFAATVLCWGGYLLVSEALANDQLTPVLQWKMGYVYAVVPATGVFFIAFAIEHLCGRPRAVSDQPVSDV